MHQQHSSKYNVTNLPDILRSHIYRRDTTKYGIVWASYCLCRKLKYREFRTRVTYEIFIE